MAKVHHYYHGKPGELENWFWFQVFRMSVVGVVISIPMALFGSLSAPEGTTRASGAWKATTEGHSFLWKHAGMAAMPALDATVEWLDSTER